MLCYACILQIWQARCLFLFSFAFELPSIFVMLSIVKAQLVNATENCVLNIFSVWIFFTVWIIPYPLHSHLVRMKGFKYCKAYWVVKKRSNFVQWVGIACKLLYEQNFLIGKKNWQFVFWPKRLSFDNFKKFALASFYKWKKESEI